MLTSALGGNHRTYDFQTGAGAALFEDFFGDDIGVGHYLVIGNDGAVIERDEGNILVASLGAYPAHEGDLLSDQVLFQDGLDFDPFVECQV